MYRPWEDDIPKTDNNEFESLEQFKVDMEVDENNGKFSYQTIGKY